MVKEKLSTEKQALFDHILQLYMKIYLAMKEDVLKKKLHNQASILSGIPIFVSFLFPVNH